MRLQLDQHKRQRTTKQMKAGASITATPHIELRRPAYQKLNVLSPSSGPSRQEVEKWKPTFGEWQTASIPFFIRPPDDYENVYYDIIGHELRCAMNYFHRDTPRLDFTGIYTLQGERLPDQRVQVEMVIEVASPEHMDQCMGLRAMYRFTKLSQGETTGILNSTPDTTSGADV